MDYKEFLSVTNEQMEKLIASLNQSENTSDRINELLEFCDTYEGVISDVKDIADDQLQSDAALAVAIIYTGNPDLFDKVVDEGYFDELCEEAELSLDDLKDMADSWDVIKNFYLISQDMTGDYTSRLNKVRADYTRMLNTIIDDINENRPINHILKTIDALKMQVELHKNYIRSYLQLNGEHQCDVIFVIISLCQDLYHVE